MRKKYTKYTASLLIGLFSLSSCVNTGRALNSETNASCNKDLATIGSVACYSTVTLSALSVVIYGLTYLSNPTAIAPLHPNSTSETPVYRGNHTNSSIPNGRSLNNSSFNSSLEAKTITAFLNNLKGYEQKQKDQPYHKTYPSNDARKPAKKKSTKLKTSKENIFSTWAQKISNPDFNVKELINQIENQELDLNIQDSTKQTLLAFIVKNPTNRDDKEVLQILKSALKNNKTPIDLNYSS